MPNSAYNNVYGSGGPKSQWMPSPNTNPLQTVVDSNTDVFRYGLYKYGRSSKFEDPTVLGFTIEFVEDKSPITKDLVFFLTKYAPRYPEIATRLKLYPEMLRNIRAFFSSQESVVNTADADTFVRSHYINSVTGLSKLNQNFVKYGEDKLTFVLQEDIGLSSTYFTHLVRSFMYSHSTGRQIIPTNLMQFALRIKISEIRNFTSIGRIAAINKGVDVDRNREVLEALRTNTSCMTYTLYDCHFSAMNSAPNGDAIEQSGIGANLPDYATTSIDLFYKSSSRYLRPTLQGNALYIDDAEPELGLGSPPKTSGLSAAKDPQKVSLGPNGQPVQPDNTTKLEPEKLARGFPAADAKKSSFYLNDDTLSAPANSKTTLPGDLPNVPGVPKVPSSAVISTVPGSKKVSPGLAAYKRQVTDLIGTTKPEPNPLAIPGYENISILDRVKTNISSSINKRIEEGKDRLRQKRSELLNNLVGSVQRKLGIKKIIPANIYHSNGEVSNAFEQFKSDIGFGITDSIFKAINK